MASQKISKAQVEDALGFFARAEGPELIEASGVLLSANALVAYARDPRMKAGLDRLTDQVKNSAASEYLPYLARLWHMTAQAPLISLRPKLADRLRPLPLPPEELSRLRDPNDRRYAAEALADLAGSWLSDYAAQALVQEESGERARAALAAALFARAAELNASLRLVARAMGHLNITSKDPGTSRARRLVRVLEALGAGVVDIDPPVKEGIGPEVSRLFESAVRHDSIGDPVAAAELAGAILGFIRMLVRFHGTLAADADTFAAVRRLRRLFRSTEWPDQVKPEADALARAVREALLFLARQGIADDRLRKVHHELVGEIPTAMLLKQAVGEGHGIPGSLAGWLVSGRLPKTTSSRGALEASILEAIDVDLARAFREVGEIAAQLSVAEEELLDAAQDVSRALREQAEGMFRRIRRVLRHLEAAADKRGFRLRGQPGDVVEFSANEHETADGRPASRAVRLRNKIVERTRGENSIDVVLKAEVDRL
ncbi:MAG TPA: hypothetical protein VGW34_01250 [Allosphingosinicella sp.]|nr:hypothetical protein [Allosphingosinicella sp.]